MYDTRITHINRTAFVILIDCSASMQEHIFFNQQLMSKADAVAFVCNYLIEELIARATRNDKVRNYYDVGVVEYSGHGVVDLLPAAIDGFTPIDILAEHSPKRTTYNFECVNDHGHYCNSSITVGEWISPQSHGSTPMYEALYHTFEIVQRWCMKPENHESFPPIIFNITDGEYSDGREVDMRMMAQRIKGLSTANGNVLLLNIHLSTGDTLAKRILPTDAYFRTDNPYEQLLFDMSSVLPPSMEPMLANVFSLPLRGPYRGVAFNTSICELLSILSIGSQSVMSL